MLDNCHDVCTMLRDLRRLGGDSWRAKNQGVNLPSSRGIGEHSRGGDGFEPNFPDVCTARLDEREDVGHYRTFASV